MHAAHSLCKRKTRLTDTWMGSCRQQLSAEATRAEAAAVAAAEADAVWQEVLMQTEEDLDKRAETDSGRLAMLQRTAEEVRQLPWQQGGGSCCCHTWQLQSTTCSMQMALPATSAVWENTPLLVCVVVVPQTQVKLRAEANILSRANERLKAEKATDTARVSALQQEARALREQLTDAGAVADKLRAELGERDGVISDNYATMQGLRRRVQELETHKFVLTYKVCCCGHGQSGRLLGRRGCQPRMVVRQCALQLVVQGVRTSRCCVHASHAVHLRVECGRGCCLQNEAAAAELQPKDEQLEVMQATVTAQVGEDRGAWTGCL